MSGETTIRLAVLFTHELRAAAKAVLAHRRAAHELADRFPEPATVPPDEARRISDLGYDALELCVVALYHAADDARPIVVATLPDGAS